MEIPDLLFSKLTSVWGENKNSIPKIAVYNQDRDVELLFEACNYIYVSNFGIPLIESCDDEYSLIKHVSEATFLNRSIYCGEGLFMILWKICDGKTKKSMFVFKQSSPRKDHVKLFKELLFPIEKLRYLKNPEFRHFCREDGWPKLVEERWPRLLEIDFILEPLPFIFDFMLL